jgi:hypothetical protein
MAVCQYQMLWLKHRNREQAPSHICFHCAWRICVSKCTLHTIFTSLPRQFAGFFSLPGLYLKGR